MAPWQGPYWPAKRGKDFEGEGFFMEPDKENLPEDFCATATTTAKNILARYFHQGAQSLRKARGGNVLKTPNPKENVSCDKEAGGPTSVSETLSGDDGNVLMGNSTRGL